MIHPSDGSKNLSNSMLKTDMSQFSILKTDPTVRVQKGGGVTCKLRNEKKTKRNEKKRKEKKRKENMEKSNEKKRKKKRNAKKRKQNSEKRKETKEKEKKRKKN